MLKIHREAQIDGRPCTIIGEGLLRIIIFNLRDGETPLGVYRLEHRSNSPLANPFPMNGELERDWSCNCFHRLLNRKANRGVVLRHQAERLLHTMELELREHGELQLACWCAPKRCHTWSIAELLIHRVRDIA